ncbi:MAG: hypothetical protein IJS17_00655 [Clostridia bacterium]|nr:hypothetical protein [Clostridia bacterium]
MKKFVLFIFVLVLTACALFSLATYCSNVHYISIEKFEEETAEFDFLPKAAELGRATVCKGRIVRKGFVFKRTFYEMFTEFETDEDFLAQQKKTDDIYTCEDVNVKGVFGGLKDHVVCEKDGFQYRIADNENLLYSYPKQFLLIGSSLEKRRIIFVFVDDRDGGSVDDWNDYLKNELYL